MKADQSVSLYSMVLSPSGTTVILYLSVMGFALFIWRFSYKRKRLSSIPFHKIGKKSVASRLDNF